MSHTSPYSDWPSSSDSDSLLLEECLDRANHPDTPEGEAKAAFFIASRLMKQFNVTQAEVLAHEPPSAQQQYAGQSVVGIKRRDGDDSIEVRFQTFLEPLCWAMTKFFDCKYYTSKGWTSLHVTFYGIAENTTAAAMGLESAYNLVVEWVRKYRGVAKKNSYLLGVAQELNRRADREQREEEREAKEAETKAFAEREKQEEAHRQAEIHRLAPLGTNAQSSPPASGNSPQLEEQAPLDTGYASRRRSPSAPQRQEPLSDDEVFDDSSDNDGGRLVADFLDDNNDVDTSGPIEEQMRKVKTEESVGDEENIGYEVTGQLSAAKGVSAGDRSDAADQTSVAANDESSEKTLGWSNHAQLILFRDTAKQIADEYLEKKQMKLKNGPKRKSSIRDWDAYDQGKRDSVKIDVHRKRMKEGTDNHE